MIFRRTLLAVSTASMLAALGGCASPAAWYHIGKMMYDSEVERSAYKKRMDQEPDIYVKFRLADGSIVRGRLDKYDTLFFSANHALAGQKTREIDAHFQSKPVGGGVNGNFTYTSDAGAAVVIKHARPSGTGATVVTDKDAPLLIWHDGTTRTQVILDKPLDMSKVCPRTGRRLGKDPYAPSICEP